MQLHGSLSVKELVENSLISRGIYTICIREQWSDLDSIYNYYSRRKTFLKLKNCGVSKNDELIALCQQFAARSAEELPEEIASPIPEEINPLPALTLIEAWNTKTREDQQVIEYRYEVLKGKLTRRTKNHLLALCKGDAAVTALLSLLSESYSYAVEKSLRRKSPPSVEFNHLVAEVTAMLARTSSSEQTSSDDQDLLIQRLSALVPCQSTDEMGIFIKNNFHKLPAGDFPLLQFAHIFIQNYAGINQKHKEIFFQLSRWYTANAHKTTASVAARLGLSPTTIGKIVIKEGIGDKLLHLLGEAVAMLQAFQLKIPSSFFLQTSSYQWCRVDELLVETPFTIEFAARFIIDLNPSYEAAEVQTSRGKQWLFFFKPVMEPLKVVSFLESVHKLFTAKTYTKRFLSLSGLLAPFCKENLSATQYNDLLILVKSLLNYLYGLRPDEQGVFHLERTLPKRYWEHVYDVLKEQNKVCSADEIAALLVLKGISIIPDNMWSKISSLKFFSSLGNNTFGLKEWQSNRYEFGRINKQLIIKFLQKESKPMHIDEIVQWVKKHRQAKKDAIYKIMRTDPLHLFQHFGDGFYGLANKEYKVYPL